ncbi:hypothetical protein HYW74_03065 [Candidatus Pacearchaeota archaeon]|nr:hypothetical protein [Candidatus Pacearchaeota archaeon]
MGKRNHMQTKRNYLSWIYQGKTIKEMAEARGISYLGVYSYLVNNNLIKKYRAFHPDEARIRPDYNGIEGIVMNNKMKTARELAKYFRVTKASIYNVLHAKDLFEIWQNRRKL